jgi:hypothetical protein
MDSCGRDCDTNLRLFFSSASGLKRSRDRRRRWCGRRSGDWWSSGCCGRRSRWGGHRQLHDQPSPLLSSLVLQPPPLQSLLKLRDLSVLQGLYTPSRDASRSRISGLKTPGDAAISGRCCKPSNPGRRDSSRSRLALFRRGGSPWQHPVRPREVAGVTVGNALKIILMLGLRFPERAGWRDFGHHFARP